MEPLRLKMDRKKQAMARFNQRELGVIPLDNLDSFNGKNSSSKKIFLPVLELQLSVFSLVTTKVVNG